MKKIIAFIVSGVLVAALCAAQTSLPENGGFHQEGIASWYGPEYQGRPTTSGELFDPNQFTAAHLDLPFGTIVTVTNMINGKQVQVRINDRGPFNPSRIIDVSKAAAERLDMLGTGTAQVSVELAPRNAIAQGPTPSSQQVAPASGLNTPTTPAPMASYYDAQNNPLNSPARQYEAPQPANIPQPMSPQQMQPQQMQPAPQPRQTAQPQTGIPAPNPNAVANNRLPTPSNPTFANSGTQPARTTAAPPPANSAPPQAARTAAAPPPANAYPGQTTTRAAPNPTPQTPPRTVSAPAPNTQAQAGNAARQPNAVGTAQPAAASRPATAQPTNPGNNSSRLPTPMQPTVVPQPAPSRAAGNPAAAQPVPAAPTAPRIPSAQSIPTNERMAPMGPSNSTANTARTPAAAPQTASTGALQPVPSTMRPPPAATVDNYQRANAIPPGQTTYRPVETYATAELKGDPVKPGNSYRLQVGSYRVPNNAVEAIDRLTKMGISAQYEPFGETYYRVVISNVRAEHVDAMCVKLGNAGFREAVARIER